jgi:hypothetical protein
VTHDPHKAFQSGVAVYRATPDRLRDKVLRVASKRADLLDRIEVLRTLLDDLSDAEVCDVRHPWRAYRYAIVKEIENITDPVLPRTDLEHGVAYSVWARNMPPDTRRIIAVWDADQHGFVYARFKGHWYLDRDYHVADNGTVKPYARHTNQPPDGVDLLDWLRHWRQVS